MQVPLEITWRGVNPTPDLETLIREKVDKLDRMHNNLISCRVAVEKPNAHISSGNPYAVRVDMRVPPGHELVVKEEVGQGEQHRGVDSVIRHVFSSAERVLEKQREKQRGEVKPHPTQEVTGFVDRVFPEKGYGFIRSMEGHQVYFHENAVLNNEFGRLEAGDGVRFLEEAGREGPQASTVHLIGRPS